MRKFRDKRDFVGLATLKVRRTQDIGVIMRTTQLKTFFFNVNERVNSCNHLIYIIQNKGVDYKIS